MDVIVLQKKYKTGYFLFVVARLATILATRWTGNKPFV